MPPPPNKPEMKTNVKAKKAPKKDEAPPEKQISRTNDSEVQDLIKQLGLDAITHETSLDTIPAIKKGVKKSLNQVDDGEGTATKSVKEEKKAKKTAKSGPSTSGEILVPKAIGKNKPSAVEIGSQAPKGKPNKKHAETKTDEASTAKSNKKNMLKNKPTAVENHSQKPTAKLNKKIIFDDGQSGGSDETLGGKSLVNKKITFDDTGTALPAEAPKANKKIVFDDSYLVNSEKKLDKDSETPWYHLLITPDRPWYEQGEKLAASTRYVTGPETKTLEEEGRQLLADDTTNFGRVRQASQQRSENRWLQTVLKQGALADKIAAHTLLIQESVPHTLTSLRFLLSLLNVKGRRECMASLDALLRLLTEGKILNPNAKLVAFDKQPIGALYDVPAKERSRLLALWSFESQLKDWYGEMVVALDDLLKDAVDNTRRKAITALRTLLSYSPEREQDLLTRLVNKVGDPTRAVATSTVSQLERLLQQHPNMKLVVVSEMERLLYRPNLNTKAQYYGLCFLSQILLEPEDVQLANKLIIIYVSFFKACVKKGEVDSKLMAALLTGVKRAFPYTQSASTGVNPLDSHVDTLFKLVHLVRFGLAIQVLCILDQIVGTGQGNADRFYSVLFRKLLDPDLAQSTKLALLLNMVFQALKRDDSLERQRAFVKRILQVALTCPPALCCGFLYLVSELLKLRPELRQSEANRQLAIQGDGGDDDDDDEEEHYEDADEEPQADATDAGEVAADSSRAKEANEEAAPKASSTWVHRKNVPKGQSATGKGYDPLARNPTYARAHLAGGYWELGVLAQHNHPSVALFAKTIMEGQPIDYCGDPLQDFTLIRFLDRFVFRNPKQVSAKEIKGSSQRKVLGKRKTYTPAGARSMAVDSKEFLAQPSDAIAPEEMFLYQYFKRRATTRGLTEDDEVESVASDDFQEYLTQVGSMDFAADAKPKPKDKKKKKGKSEEDSDEEEGAGSESDLEAAEDDSNDDFEDDEEFQDAFKDFDDMLDEVPSKNGGQEYGGGDADEDNDEDDDDDEDGEEDEDDDEIGDDIEDGDDQPGFNEEDVDFSDEDGEEVAGPSKIKTSAKATTKNKKRSADDEDDLDLIFSDEPKQKKKRRQMMGNDTGSDFAAAEEFAQLLEDNDASGLDLGGTSEALANKDRASVKQLQWEMSRDRWMKDLNRPRRGGGAKGKFAGGKSGAKGKFKSSAKSKSAAPSAAKRKRGAKR